MKVPEIRFTREITHFVLISWIYANFGEIGPYHISCSTSHILTGNKDSLRITVSYHVIFEIKYFMVASSSNTRNEWLHIPDWSSSIYKTVVHMLTHNFLNLGRVKRSWNPDGTKNLRASYKETAEVTLYRRQTSLPYGSISTRPLSALATNCTYIFVGITRDRYYRYFLIM